MAKQPLKNRYEQFCVDAKRLLDALGQKPTLSGRAMYEAACALATLHFPEDTELGGVGPRSLIWSLHPAVSGNDGGGSSGALAVAEVLRSILERRPPLDIKKRSDTHEERSRVYAQCPFYEQKRSYAIEKKLAFVLMPFKEPWSDRLWKQHLHPYLSDPHVRARRADDLYGQGVMEDVYHGIVSAQLVVADCTGRNPNVLYELGLAHALGKRTVLLSQAESDIPFDLRRFRFCIYEDNSSGYPVLERVLKAVVGEVFSPT